jgi:hypothetical protein
VDACSIATIASAVSGNPLECIPGALATRRTGAPAMSTLRRFHSSALTSVSPRQGVRSVSQRKWSAHRSVRKSTRRSSGCGFTSLRCQGQDKEKAAAAADFALNPDATAMQLDDLLADAQA